MDEQLRLELESMSIEDRLRAVALDIQSRRDRYRAFEPHDLAELLEINDSWKPEGGKDWTNIRYSPRVGAAEIVRDYGGAEALCWLDGHVTSVRLEHLEKVADESEDKLISELTEHEKRLIEDHLQQETFKNPDGRCLAIKSLGQVEDVEITFEGIVECDGTVIELKTPYDFRDGLCTNLENCLTDEWYP